MVKQVQGFENYSEVRWLIEEGCLVGDVVARDIFWWVLLLAEKGFDGKKVFI